MPLTEIRIGDQTVQYDREATAAVHGTHILQDFGIDPNKEGEAFEYGPAADGGHLYGGWFYLVGEMVTPGKRNYHAPDSRHFEFFFTTAHPSARAFGGGPALAIEFTTHVKWVLPESADSGRRPAKTI